MSDVRAIADAQQRLAIDPARSTWVMANAGTGKTHVLTNRILRLLLDGAQPQHILCLTFTRAAAAEMRNRLAGRLGRWTLMADGALAAELEKLALPAPDAGTLQRARQLFARVLDAPGGVRILTIHAFAQWLLTRFPLEAGVAPNAKVLDETEARQLLDQARDEQIAAIAHGEDAALVAALDTVARRVSEADYATALNRLLGERGRLAALGSDVEMVIAALREGLGLGDHDDEAAILSATWRDTDAMASTLYEIVESLSRLPGSKNDAMADGIKAWLERGEGGEAEARRLWPRYRQAFIKATEEAPRQDAPTKKWRTANPLLLPVIEQEAARLIAAEERGARRYWLT